MNYSSPTEWSLNSWRLTLHTMRVIYCLAHLLEYNQWIPDLKRNTSTGTWLQTRYGA